MAFWMDFETDPRSAISHEIKSFLFCLKYDFQIILSSPDSILHTKTLILKDQISKAIKLSYSITLLILKDIFIKIFIKQGNYIKKEIKTILNFISLQ
jgi:hypothetical protein